MTDLLKGQLDYIYFFYGLSFLFLALICFNIDWRKSRALPWYLFGLFGLVHGANEWIDFWVVTYGQGNFLAVVQPVVLGVSYILLFEFARRGYLRLMARPLARAWVYVPLAVMIIIGARSGPNGLTAAIRYFLGFPAAALSAFVISRAARVERSERWPLYALSTILALNAIATGLIVPPVDFLIAQQLNFDTFYRTFGFPVQLARGILALCMAMAVWVYSSVLSGITYQPQKYRLSLKLTKWVILFTMVALIAGGWAFTNYLDYYASIKIIKDSKDRADSPLNLLVKELTVLEKIARTLSRLSAIRNAALSQKEIEKATPLLDNYRKRFDVRSCLLADIKGGVIASAGEDIQAKAQDKPTIPLAYFKDALSGNTGYYFSPGSKYSERVYYVSYPIKDAAGAVGAVVLVSKVVAIAPVLQYRFFSIVITFVVCILAITLFIALRKRESLIEFIDKTNTQLQEVDRLKTDFISIVSHELRTPLTAITNAATILLKGKLSTRGVDPREKELVEMILKNTAHQTRMVSDLLDVSKIEAGVMPIVIEKADCVAVIKEAVSSFSSQAEEKGIGLRFSCASEALTAPLDPDHTRRVMVNLLANALKFTPAGGSITVTLREETEKITVSVSDTGPGIPRDEIGKLFTKFYRSSDAAYRHRGGTGLGLVISKGLVEAQGGRIWLDSRPGEGATFYFTIPKGAVDGRKTAGSR